jgi:hypothetical protein
MGVGGTWTESGPKAATTEVRPNSTDRGLIFMLASYKWIVGCTLLIGFLGGTLAYAKPIDVEQQIPKRNRDGMTVLTMSLHGVGPFYSAKRSHGLTDLVPDPENTAFDIFCSVFDTEWLEPGQYSLTPDALRLRGLGSKPAMPTRRRYQLRPC